jgi:hypothetical protein
VNDEPQEDLAKFGYKTNNREVENLRILLLYAGESLEPIY